MAETSYETTYLGDAVYARIENGMIRLHTSDGIRETNVIFLEAEVYDNLVAWVNALKRIEE
jgi:hypothetical protein